MLVRFILRELQDKWNLFLYGMKFLGIKFSEILQVFSYSQELGVVQFKLSISQKSANIYFFFTLLTDQCN